MKNEARIQSEIMLAVGSLPSVRLFRNQVGLGWVGEVIKHPPIPTPDGAVPDRSITIRHPRRVRMGLFPGSSDLIGWTTHVIQNQDVGRRVAIFTSIEVKDPAGHVQENQKQWIERLRCDGGISFVAHSKEEALKQIAEYRFV